MNNYVITCTSACDLNKDILNKKNIKYACLKMIVNGQTYNDDFFSNYDYSKFYDDISNGMMPTTSQVGYGDYIELFEPILKDNDIIHICISSGLSGDYSTAKLVADELNEKSQHKITVIDSLGASSGYGMLVLLANDNKENGMSYDENIIWLENIKHKIHHWFISTDLTSYIRGGRISKTEGFVGTALKICPLMNMDSNGTLKPVEKIRTFTKASKSLVDKMIDLCDKGLDYSGYCMISCSNCDEQANNVANLIKTNFANIKDVPIYHVGTTIGSHTGPGTIALYFIGKNER